MAAQPVYAEKWSTEGKAEFVESCVANVTADPSIVQAFTFSQIYNTCILIRNYFDATYTNKEMEIKKRTYGPRDQNEIFAITQQCIDHLRGVADEYPKDLDTLVPTKEYL